VEVNLEKTKVVDTIRGETFEFLGFEFRRVRKRTGDGHFILLTPRKKARLALKARMRELLRRGGATPLKELIAQLNTVLTGWVQYFRVGNASRAFSEIRDYVEMKVRILLTRRKRRHKRSVGWRRWSNEYLYGVLGLFWDWKLRPLQGAEAYQ
jgi:RNA-directed DNA polymerase